MTTENRPWGSFTVLLDEPNTKVKKIVVLPHQRLSLQRHKYREERWIVVSGTGRITIDSFDESVSPGEQFTIPAGAVHRMSAYDQPLEFIEIQLGSYFGEDDIERLSDDYGRSETSS